MDWFKLLPMAEGVLVLQTVFENALSEHLNWSYLAL